MHMRKRKNKNKVQRFQGEKRSSNQLSAVVVMKKGEYKRMRKARKVREW